VQVFYSLDSKSRASKGWVNDRFAGRAMEDCRPLRAAAQLQDTGGAYSAAVALGATAPRWSVWLPPGEGAAASAATCCFIKATMA
jgi:hypothetical protein